jgi:3-methyladenine DNA glycosylase AlkD
MKDRVEALLQQLSVLATSAVRDSQARFGIASATRLGIPTPAIKAFAKQVGKDHELALLLWETGIFEAQAVAALIDEPKKVTKKQMEQWAKDFDSWALVDACCGYLFDKTAHAWDLAMEWPGRKAEYVKRAGFSLMAYLAVHDKKADDERFHDFFPVMEREAGDDRLYVRKAVNWALRQLGKRSKALHPLAVRTAERIQKQGSKSARWIAADALRELRGEKVRTRLSIH